MIEVCDVKCTVYIAFHSYNLYIKILYIHHTVKYVQQAVYNVSHSAFDSCNLYVRTVYIQHMMN